VGEYPSGQRHAVRARFALEYPVEVEVVKQHYFVGSTDGHTSHLPMNSAVTDRNYWNFAHPWH
jgi:hypothetical protein